MEIQGQADRERKKKEKEKIEVMFACGQLPDLVVGRGGVELRILTTAIWAGTQVTASRRTTPIVHPLTNTSSGLYLCHGLRDNTCTSQ